MLCYHIKVKKNKIIVPKAIFISFSAIINLFIIINATLPGNISSQISGFFGSIIKFFVNEFDKKVEPINVESLSIGLDTRYELNYVDGYKDNEMILGSTKKLLVAPYPANSTNANVYFTADSEDIKISQYDFGAFIEANNDTISSFTIIAAIKNTDIKTSYTFNIVNKVAPLNFNVDENVTIKEGLTSIIDITPLNTNEGVNERIKYNQYYDNTLLTYSSEDDSIATIDKNGIIKAHKKGKTNIVIKNQNVTKKLSVIVENNLDSIINANDTWSIKSISNNAYIGDVYFDNTNDYISEKGKHNTPLSIDWGNITPSDTNVIYESENPLIATVDKNGLVRGNRKKGTAKIKASLASNLNMSKTIEIEVGDVVISSLSYQNENDKDITFENGLTKIISPKILPVNVTLKNLIGTSSDNNIIEVSSRGSVIAITGKNAGSCILTIAVKDNEHINISYNITITPLKPINSTNEENFFALIRKSIGHLLLFINNGIITTLALFYLLKDKLKGKKLWLIIAISLIFGFLIAGLSELIQLAVPGRNGNWNDVLIDTIGYAIGLFILKIIIAIIHAFRIKKSRAKPANQ